MSDRFDVVVAGAGNAALSAAHAAREAGASVLVVEKAPREWAGGNTYFTAGGFRTPYSGLAELRPLLDEPLSDEEAAVIDIPPYSEHEFVSDLERVTEARCDPELADVLARDAWPTTQWLRAKGLRYRLMTERQAIRIDGRLRFWGGLALGTIDGGKGLSEQHIAGAVESGVELRCGMAVVGLSQGPSGDVIGVQCADGDGVVREVRAGAVVLACGGFEADPRLRAAYLGPRWDLAKVRGTPFNTGEGLLAALDAGAQAFGNWSGCHAVAWDVAAPPTGDRERTNTFTRGSYPLGIVVNSAGQRFIDEGADLRVYTYAKYGGEILRQPGLVAFQLFDAKTEPLLRKDEYPLPGVSQVRANSLAELAHEAGIPPRALRRTVEEFNAAVQPGEFDPVRLDGKRTEGVDPPKSNWAIPLDTPPYVAFPVTCGITFTFGGLRIDTQARVLDRRGEPIRGLCAAGELVGGLFYGNYPGGTGLMAGAVFGRRAGTTAAELTSRHPRSAANGRSPE